MGKIRQIRREKEILMTRYKETVRERERKNVPKPPFQPGEQEIEMAVKPYLLTWREGERSMNR